MIPVQSVTRTGRPVRPQFATDRCRNPGTTACPPIPGLLTLIGVDGVPFEYPLELDRDPRTGLHVVTSRQTVRRQQFVPPVRDGLIGFVRRMAGFGMPVSAIITYGSLYCRCITGTDRLSNHSFGEAIDVVGVRWADVGGPASALPETIVHNYADPGQRALLRRINACLRLSFPLVIDYHRPDHRDHFHCDLNRRRGRVLFGRSTLCFVQEALSLELGRQVPITGRSDRATAQGLSELTGSTLTQLRDPAEFARALDTLFERVAAGR